MDHTTDVGTCTGLGSRSLRLKQNFSGGGRELEGEGMEKGTFSPFSAVRIKSN